MPPRVSICILVLNSERILERHYFLFKLASSPSACGFYMYVFLPTEIYLSWFLIYIGMYLVVSSKHLELILCFYHFLVRLIYCLLVPANIPKPSQCNRKGHEKCGKPRFSDLLKKSWVNQLIISYLYISVSSVVEF